MQEELLTENTIVKVEEFDPFYNIHRGDVPLKDVLAFCNKNMVADAYEIFEIYVLQNESKIRLFHVDNDKEITLTVDFENKERIINILFQNGDFGYKVKKEVFDTYAYLRECRIPEDKIDDFAKKIGVCFGLLNREENNE